LACKSKFSNAEDLNEGCNYLQLRVDTIKSFIINLDAVNAYTWWILNTNSDI